MELDKKSKERLIGVDKKLAQVVELAFSITTVPFIVTEGVRTLERQKQLFAAKASQTMNSKHLTGRAVDIAAKVGNEVRWDWPLYAQLAVAMKEAAKQLGVNITWGGDWKSFKDGPHFELKD